MLTPIGRQRKLSTEVFNSPKLRANLETVGDLYKGPSDTAASSPPRTEARRIITPKRRLSIGNLGKITLNEMDDVEGIKSVEKTERIPTGGKLIGPIDRFKGRTRTASLSVEKSSKPSGAGRKRSRTLSSRNKHELKKGSRMPKGSHKGVQMKITDLIEAQSKIKDDADEQEVKSTPPKKQRSQ